MRRWLGLLLALVALGAAHPARAQGLVLTTPYVGYQQSFGDALDQTAPLDPRISFIRSGSAWNYNASGVLTAFGTNVPVLPAYYNAGGELSGWNLDGAATNSCLNSETNSGPQTVSMLAGNWAISMLGSGSEAISGSGINYAGGSSTVTASSPAFIYLTSTTSVTLTPTGTVSHLQCERSNGVTTAKPGAVTGPIPTTSVAVTRNTTDASTTLNSIGQGQSGTWVFGLMLPWPNSSNQTIAFINTGDGSDSGFAVYVSQTTKHVNIACESNGVVLAQIGDLANFTFGVWHTLAFEFGPDGGAFSLDAAGVRSFSYSCPGVLARVKFGNNPGLTLPLDGYLKPMAAYTAAVPHDALQAFAAGTQPLNRDYDISYIIGQSTAIGAHSVVVLSSPCPYPDQVFALNYYWGTRGAANLKASLIPPPITGLKCAFETNGPNPPITPDLQYGESPTTGLGAQQVFQGAPGNFIVANAAAPGKILTEISSCLVATAPLRFTDGTTTINTTGDLNCTSTISNVASMAGITVGMQIFGPQWSNFGTATVASLPGGSTIIASTAAQDSQPFANMVSGTQQIAALIHANGGTITMPAVQLIEGEGDKAGHPPITPPTPPATYALNSINFANRVNIELKAATGQGSTIRIPMMQLAPSSDGIPYGISQTQLSLGTPGNAANPSDPYNPYGTDTRFTLAGPSYMIALSPTWGPHFYGTGQRLQAEYLGKANDYEQRTPGTQFLPLYPITGEINWTGPGKADFVATFNVPVGQLVDDPSWLPQGFIHNSGFAFHDCSPVWPATGPCIDSASLDHFVIVPPNQIHFYLTGPSTGLYPTLNAGMDPPTIAYDCTPGQNIWTPPAANCSLPTVASAGSGGTDGTCTLTVGTPADAYLAATYSGTISGGALASVDSILTWGGYPAADIGTYNNVPVTGCGLVGAKINGFKLQQGFASNRWKADWLTIRDQDTTMGYGGDHLYNGMVIFTEPVN